MSGKAAQRFPALAGYLRVAAACCLTIPTAWAGEPPPVTSPLDFDTEQAVSRALDFDAIPDSVLASAVLPDEQLSAADASGAPAAELAAGLDVQVTQSRRRFRTRAIDWVSGHSIAIGQLADFLIGGADSGWHLTVDPRGQDEYILEWKVRFR